MTITKIKYFDGEYIEYKNELGQTHREDGPAYEYISGVMRGRKIYFINGLIHRLDGPSIIGSDILGNIESWVYKGKQINCKTQEQFERLIKLMILW